MLRLRTYAWCALALVLIFSRDFRPDAIALAMAPYQFDVVTWEVANLPDKWARRVSDFPQWLFEDSDATAAAARAERFFEIGQRLRWIDSRLITLDAATPSDAPPDPEAANLRRERDRLARAQAALQPAVEDTLESAIADSLQELGFRAWTGVFPPVDTVLTGSPTFLVLSPRDRIHRIEGGLMQTGLNGDQRDRVESRVETETGQSALVVNTGGLALYPSITANHIALEHAVEIVAHEWVHQWLWFRPLGRRYFASPELTMLNETVATIAGEEIGRLAMDRLNHDPGSAAPDPYDRSTRENPSTHTHNEPTGDDARHFDFQAEMRATRIMVDALLDAGDIQGAETYMEERRRLFVSEGYPIRKLNQAYFAFHGTYGTTGAAGVSVIGEQVQELRRRSPSLTEFLRTAAQFTGPEDLARYIDGNTP